jgi:predicted enzyme related to lactoylglutathione lyase
MGQAATPKPALKFGGTVIYLDHDVAGVLDFYRRAFGLETRFYDPNHEFGELETGGASIAFATAKAYELMLPGLFQPPPTNQPSGTELAFITDDVPAAFARATDAGAATVASPRTMPWGQTVAYVRSTEGTLVALCTPTDS